MPTDLTSFRLLKWILAGLVSVVVIAWMFLLSFPQYDGSLLVFLEVEWRLLAGIVVLIMIGFYLGFLPVESILRRESHNNLYLQRIQNLSSTLDEVRDRTELFDQIKSFITNNLPYDRVDILRYNDQQSTLIDPRHPKRDYPVKNLQHLLQTLEEQEVTLWNPPHGLSFIGDNPALVGEVDTPTQLKEILILSVQRFETKSVLHRTIGRVLAQTIGEHTRRIAVRRREEKIQDELNRKIEQRTQEIQTQQQFLESVLKTLEEGLIAIESSGEIIHMNQTAKQLLKTDQQSPSHLKDVGHILSEEVVSARGSSGTHSTQVQNRQFEYEWHSIGDTDRELLVLRDRTEIHSLQKQANVNQTLSTIGEMAGAIVHELRNPLGGMEIYLGMLKRRVESEQLEQPINKLEEGFRTLQNITETLLNYTRTSQPEFDSVNPNQIIDSALHQCQELIERRRATIERKLPELPSIKGDSDQLLQVFVNLVRNGVQAHEESDEVTITIAGERQEHSIIVQVTDQGVGMNPEEQQQVFERFFSTKEEGTGLGLAICRRMIEVHSGSIDVESIPGEGSTFTVQLPINTEDVFDDE